jgi:hypothetical protein
MRALACLRTCRYFEFTSHRDRSCNINLNLHETTIESSQVGRLSAHTYLPRVNVYLPEIRV